MNKLTKKLFRDMRKNKMQFITIFLMVFLGVFVYAGIHAYMDGMQKSSDDYYDKYSANAHRGDYKISAVVDSLYEDTRKKVCDYVILNLSK